MSKLLRFTTTMIAFVLLLICIARLVGNAHPGGIESPFTETEGVPSLFGVQPGVTSYEETLELLQARGLTHLAVLKQTGDVFGLGSARIILTRNPSDEQVARIELVAAQNSDWGSLGQIVSLLGPPQRMVVERQFTQSFWHGGQLEFVHGHRMVGFVDIEDPLESVEVIATPGGIPVNATVWQGFGSIEVYLGTGNQ